MARERFDGQTPYSPTAYGGVMGMGDRWDDNGVRLDENGNPVGTIIKGNKSSEVTDVERFRGRGTEMQGRDAYQFDWSQADKDRANAVQSGAAQGDANDAWRRQATEGSSFEYGKSLVDRGSDNQQAASLSASGGALAQVGAGVNGMGGRASFVQKGMQGVEAQKADDMAAGRSGYAQGLAQQRKMDQTGQSLSDQQTEFEASAAAQQRKLNDAGQYGMEKMGVDVQQQSLASRQHMRALADKQQADARAASDADDARAVGYVSAGINAIPVAGPVMNAAMAPAAGEALDRDPNSDERVKDIQPANALLGMIQTPGRLGSDPEPDNGPATEANTTPSMTGYDNSMFKRKDPAPRTWGSESKENPDDRGAPNKDALHAGIEKSIKYGRDPEDVVEKRDAGKIELGVSGAPKGYSASRAGKSGDMFGGNAQGSSWDEDHKMAPGTRDVLKYGTPSVRSERDMDSFSKAVMTSGMEAKKPAFLNPESPSDERVKNKVETPEEKKAREDKEDAEETAKFMQDVPKGAVQVKKPESYEEASKRIDERNEQDRQIKAAQQKSREDEAGRYMANQDAELIRRNNNDKWLPGFVARWSNKKIEERAKNRTPEQNIEQAVSRDKRDQEIEKTRHKYDGFVPQVGKDFIQRGIDAGAIAPKVRQPTSFTREQPMSDERAKNIVGLRQESDGVEQHWDQDVDTKAKSDTSSSGASLSGPAPKYSSPKEAPSAAKPAPGKAKTRKYTDDELKKIGDDMLANTRAQSDSQLSQGSSVQEAAKRGSNSWLDDYMTSGMEAKRPAFVRPDAPSDEGSKSKGGNALIEMQKDANRKLRGETYTYKEGFGEDTNQLHHGFMAQNLEENPITKTAVREDGTGIKKVNNEDALRVTAAGVASLQEQNDEMEKAIDALAARRGKKRVA